MVRKTKKRIRHRGGKTKTSTKKPKASKPKTVSKSSQGGPKKGKLSLLEKATGLVNLARDSQVLSKAGEILSPGNRVSAVAKRFGFGRQGGYLNRRVLGLRASGRSGGSLVEKGLALASLLRDGNVLSKAARIVGADSLGNTLAKVGFGGNQGGSFLGDLLGTVAKPFTSALQGATFGLQQGLSGVGTQGGARGGLFGINLPFGLGKTGGERGGYFPSYRMVY